MTNLRTFVDFLYCQIISQLNNKSCPAAVLVKTDMQFFTC